MAPVLTIAQVHARLLKKAGEARRNHEIASLFSGRLDTRYKRACRARHRQYLRMARRYRLNFNGTN